MAALIAILWDPLMVEEIGFQFSFGITAAILLWFSPCDAFLQMSYREIIDPGFLRDFSYGT